MKFRALLIGIVAIAAITWWFLNQTVSLSTEKRFLSALHTLDQGRAPDPEQLNEIRLTINSLAENPESLEAAEILDAVVLLRGDRVESALRKLAELDQDGAQRSYILLYAGEALYKLQRYSEAARTLGVLVAEDADNLPARRWLSATFYDLGAFNAAIVELKEVIRLDPSDYRPHNLLGIMYEDFEQHAEAIKHFEIAASLVSDTVARDSIRLSLARARIALHEYPEAIELLEQVNASGQSCVLQARCLLATGMYQDALAKVKQAVDLGDDSWQRYLIQAEALEAAGESANALLVLQEAGEKFPNEAEVHYRLGLSLQKAGDVVAAKQRMEVWEQQRLLAARLTELNLQAIDNPYDAAVRIELAKTCEMLGRHELALMWRKAARSCESNSLIP